MSIRSVTEGLDDYEKCRGIVLSLRTLLSMGVPIREEHIREIAWADDAGTKAMIEAYGHGVSE